MLKVSQVKKLPEYLQPRNFCDGAAAGVDFGVQPGEMMSVRLTAFCSERCPFCIAEEDMKTKLPSDIDAVIEAIKANPPRKLNTIGGEPLLFLDRCIKLNQGVEDVVEENIYTTSLPRTVLNQWELFQQFMESPIVSLIISVQETDWVVNNELMNSRNRFDRLALLERVLNDYPGRVQVNLNLVKGGVDSREKLYRALGHLASIGATRVRLNELQHAPDYYVNFEEISGMVLPSPYAHGCKTELESFYPGLSIQLKRSCFMVEESLGATEEDVEKLEFKRDNPLFRWKDEGVIYEDGSPSLYWKKTRKV